MVDSKLMRLQKTVVLVIDVQNDYCSERGKVAVNRKFDLRPIQKMVPKLNPFLKSVRTFKLPIIFVRMDKDKKTVANNLRLKLESSIFPFSESLCTSGTWGFEYYKIKPIKRDFEIVKHSYDAFSNPQLEQTLKELAVENLIITGVYSEICIDATLKSAFSKGYNIIVPEDLVSTTGESIYKQKIIISLWKDLFAYVVKSENIIKAMESTQVKNLINTKKLMRINQNGTSNRQRR